MSLGTWMDKQYNRFFDWLEGIDDHQKMELKAVKEVAKEHFIEHFINPNIARGQRWREALEKRRKK